MITEYNDTRKEKIMDGVVQNGESSFYVSRG